MDRSSLLCGLVVVFIVSQLSLATSLENTVTNDVNSTDHGAMNEPSHKEDKCEKHEEPFRSAVHIAKVEFERVQTLIIVTVFIMVVVLAKLGELLNAYNLCVWKDKAFECVSVQSGITNGCIQSPPISQSHGR